ncbi:hypothetical protein ACFLV3_03900 [Chloroflexota bacterium]
MIRKLAMVVTFLGVVGVVFGGIFIFQGISKTNELKQAMQLEQITLGIDTGEVEKGEVIDTPEEAQIAGDTVRDHRHGIAPTYGDLLEGGRFDATNPEQLTYAQAMNLENYLYLAVMGFGFTQSIIASGTFMIITGLALGGAGVALLRMAGTS